MQKAETRDYPKAGTAYLRASLTVHKQEAVSHSVGKVFSQQDHPNFTLVSTRECHPCLLTDLVVLIPAQQKIK